ncbi:Hypothetical predicted protein [Mytilus galloprovincialis]|uniref:Uncharacterized protein n=1 Tax=Mytilus galloprovincialis TaxID=29158 RepID=A0A8B6FLZ0_MYTGA|nr:Hypothetical predicted protein [Mytilus galloprovincialis]
MDSYKMYDYDESFEEKSLLHLLRDQYQNEISNIEHKRYSICGARGCQRKTGRNKSSYQKVAAKRFSVWDQKDYDIDRNYGFTIDDNEDLDVENTVFLNLRKESKYDIDRNYGFTIDDNEDLDVENTVFLNLRKESKIFTNYQKRSEVLKKFSGCSVFDCDGVSQGK